MSLLTLFYRYVICCIVVVYGVTGTSILLMQQRAPCVSSPQAETHFSQELHAFLSSSALQTRHLVVLSGASMVELEDEEVLRR